MAPHHGQARFHDPESHPVTLVADEDEELPHEYAEVDDILRRVGQQARGGHPVYHIHEADEGNNGYDFQDQEPHRRRSYGRQGGTQRNPPLDGTHRRVESITVKGINLKPGMFVELKEALAIGLMLTIGEDSVRSPVGARFVKIKAIWISKNDDQSVILRGLPYTRNHNLFGRLEKKKNEVCQILEVDDDDHRPEEEQSLVEIIPEQVLGTRTLIMTNKPFPQDGKPRFDPAYNTWQKVRDFAPLTCRWKMRMESKDTAQRKAGKAYGGSLIRLAENDVPKERHRVSDKKLREDWRGPTGKHPGQASTPYTFGDMFCGAGGVSRGAVMAGLEVKLAVERAPIACKTYKRNFPDTLLREQDVTEFNADDTINFHSHPIDILHLSPPCQFYSPLAYIHGDRNDVTNRDILLCCPHLINKLRPRLFTLEQTFGITHATHAAFFNALIQSFTCHGYSIRWRIVNLEEYDLPSRRNRLIMIGACPGEQFPPWPSPSRKRKTERQAIGNLRPGSDLHDVRNARVVNQPPRDGNTPLGETILGGGTQKFQHYSGTRAYTLRELACLQGFPVVHRFEGGSGQIKKQIGNAFAPCVVKVFLTHLRKHLERVDGAQHPRGPPPAPAFRPLPDPSLPSPGPYDRRPRVVKDLGMQRHNTNGPLDDYNGNLDEDEALEFALRESRKAASGASPATPRARRNVKQVVDLIDSDDEVKDTPIGGHFAPLIGRLSISSPRTPTQPRHRHVARVSRFALDFGSRSQSHSSTRELESRSRSATLDFSPEPQSRKRSLDDMHDGAEDQTVGDESPEKRERVNSSDEVLTGDEASFMSAFEKKQKSPTPHGYEGSQDDEVWTF
ncbi:hypothetical protein VPNG_01461 [Cytospora leucostoma]|uniref:DNA (cytosine-5-)-methyltransferase n=1 Tax=Cytospora leucostoma TaxID=1230097 RepID=A0A423XJS5_9PEZI|nr:hypothetical protein VPNG_01461 [Cytospora leucostoma]